MQYEYDSWNRIQKMTYPDGEEVHYDYNLGRCYPNHLNLVDTVRMAYHKNGCIARKNVFALTMSPTQMGVTNYNKRYDYSGQRNTLANVYDSVTNTSQNFSWDNSGNMVAHNGRSHSWTEDNRLLTVTDNEWFSYYQYDAGGDRTYKLPYLKTYSNRSGRRSVYWAPEHSTLYASPYLVVTPQGYTKHYYAESERVTSQIGRGRFPDLATPVTDTATANRKVRRADSLVRALNPAITDTAAQLAYLASLTNRQNDTCEAYWYHTDHLDSSSWITDSAGTAVQHLHYLPWGEDFVDQRLNGYEGARYTFSAKERDPETGLSYFGSRYYSSDLSIWLSVDPMAAKYPSLSPYVYCADNPVKLVDPNGEDYEVVVENNTITIRATYYAANEKDFKQLKKGLDSWNRQSGVYELQTGNGDSYTINFELTPVLDAEKFKDASRESNEIRGSTCNAFTIRDNYWGYQEDDRGTTRNGHVCYVKSNSPFRTTIHEIGHTLGLGEFNGDNVMTQGGNSAVITKKHIMRILDNVGFRCVGDSSNGDQITTPQAKGESSLVFSGIVKYKKQKK